MKKRVTALVTTLVLGLAIPAAAGGGNQVVIASPTADGAAIHRSAVKVTSTGTDRLDSSNVAEAIPHDCTGCEGIAVAFQAVIATGNPSQVSPSNVAVAVNSNCTSCQAYAYAYQYVVGAARGTHLSASGRQKVRDIRGQAASLVDAGLPYDQLEAQLKTLSSRFKSVIVSDLERTGADPHDGSRDADTDEAPME